MTAKSRPLPAARIIELLGLRPHPREGGFFAETYRAGETLAPADLPSRYGGARALGTAIYYLLTPETVSALHRLASDEVFHFYAGDPVEMLQLDPEPPEEWAGASVRAHEDVPAAVRGSGCLLRLGTDLEAGERPQIVVPRGVWQGARLCPGGRWALLGATVAPGFEYADYEHGDREALVAIYPAWRERIAELTV